jgi:glutathione S-transferase
LYYFGGRGLADQIRWMLAYSDVSFTQRVVGTRQRFVDLRSNGQLPFGQLPLLQIDGVEIVQSQAIIRYLARRANLTGTDAREEIACDMVAETVFDLLKLATALPFLRNTSAEAEAAHKALMRKKWEEQGGRLEMFIERNTKKGKTACTVGNSVTYADVLLAHCLTWYAEELGADICEGMPYCLDVQFAVMQKDSLQAFLGGGQYYKVGDAAYCDQVATVLDRAITGGAPAPAPAPAVAAGKEAP